MVTVMPLGPLAQIPGRKGTIRGCRRHAMLAAQMQKRSHKAVTAVSVILTAARPVAVVGKKPEH